MSPEGHGAQVLQIRIWGPKRWPTPTKSGAPCNFCFIKFLPKCTAEAPETPCTPFTHPVPGGGGYWVDNPQEPSHPQGPPTCQISSISVRSLDFYREHTYTLPPCPPWGAQIKKQKTCVSSNNLDGQTKIDCRCLICLTKLYLLSELYFWYSSTLNH